MQRLVHVLLLPNSNLSGIKDHNLVFKNHKSIAPTPDLEYQVEEDDT